MVHDHLIYHGTHSFLDVTVSNESQHDRVAVDFFRQTRQQEGEDSHRDVLVIGLQRAGLVFLLGPSCCPRFESGGIVLTHGESDKHGFVYSHMEGGDMGGRGRYPVSRFLNLIA